MDGDLIPIIGALIGAVSGSVGANLTNDWLRRRGERTVMYKNLTYRYLLQLQDACESLWYRLDNIRSKGGRLVMQESYYEHSTLYAFGCVFAYKRILLLEGIFSQVQQLQPGLGIFLEEKLESIDSEMDRMQFLVHFYRYDRIALAESVMERVDGYMRTCTYLDFKKRYEDNESHLQDSLNPAKEFISVLKGPEVAKTMNNLKDISIRIGKQTGIPSKIKIKQKAYWNPESKRD